MQAQRTALVGAMIGAALTTTTIGDTAPVAVSPPYVAPLDLTSILASTGSGRATVVVTIVAEQTDLSGTVGSPKRACKADLEVVVMKVKGERGGGDDTRFASDTTGQQDGAWVWSTGNTGTEGRFYARVRRTDECQGAASRTVRAERNES